jgi:hypothetical protein
MVALFLCFIMERVGINFPLILFVGVVKRIRCCCMLGKALISRFYFEGWHSFWEILSKHEIFMRGASQISFFV